MPSSATAPSDVQRARRSVAQASLGITAPLVPEHDPEGLEQDQQVEERGVVLRIIEIVFELVARIRDRGAVGIVDLRPAGDAGLHHVALGIIGQLVFEIVDEFRPLRARADEAHLALEHAPRLRQLVDPHLADEPADTGDARIVRSAPTAPRPSRRRCASSAA